MKTENNKYVVKIVNPPKRPDSGDEETKQQKPKSPSPLITEIGQAKPGEQVPKKQPSEPIPTTQPKPSPDKKQ